MQDKKQHGTYGFKLTWDDVAKIRAMKGTATQREIAAQFGISQPAVCHILTGEAW
jgi:hypothetical protein